MRVGTCVALESAEGVWEVCDTAGEGLRRSWRSYGNESAVRRALELYAKARKREAVPMKAGHMMRRLHSADMKEFCAQNGIRFKDRDEKWRDE